MGMKKTSNAQHPTPNAELKRVAEFDIRCSAFDVRRFQFLTR